MEEVDKGCLMIRMGVSGRMFLLVLAHPVVPDKGPLNGCVCVILKCNMFFLGIKLQLNVGCTNMLWFC